MDEMNEVNWYSDDAATFGDRVAAAREARRMTQRALAKSIGVGLKTVEGWENDLSEPRANKLQMMSGVLNVSMRWLLTGEGEGIDPELEENLPEDVNAALSEIHRLRADMLRSAERLGVVEKRLKSLLVNAEKG